MRRTQRLSQCSASRSDGSGGCTESRRADISNGGMPTAHTFHRHTVPHHGPEIYMGGEGWLVSLLIGLHILAVAALWAWLFFRARQGIKGSGRSKARESPRPVHVSYNFGLEDRLKAV